MIFDLHCDTVWKLNQAKGNNTPLSLKKSTLQIDEEKLSLGGYFAQCFAVYIPNVYPDPYEKCLSAIHLYQTELEKSDRLAPVYRYEDFTKNHERGKISAVLTMEDGCPIGEDFKKLDRLYALGVRMICLTHNRANAIGYPNYFHPLPNGKIDEYTPNATYGLTDFGKALVKKMNETGIVVDVSHLADKGFYEVIKQSEKPVIASHSNARNVCKNARNLSDDMLYRLADNGGIIGLNYEKRFLHDDIDKGKQTVARVLEHARYLKRKIGVDFIALGSDFDGIENDIELDNATKLPLLIQAFSQAGFTDEEIEKISYKNALRVFKICL